MADLTITVPDAAVARIRQAFGRLVGTNPVWQDASVDDVRAEIKNFIRSRVIDFEVGQAATDMRKDKSEETW